MDNFDISNVSLTDDQIREQFSDRSNHESNYNYDREDVASISSDLGSYHYEQDGDPFIKYFGSSLVPIDPQLPIRDQVQNTPVDFKLETRPVFHNTDYGLKDVDRFKLLVNSATDEVFDVVGKQWTPHQPISALTTFQDWCDRQDLDMTHVGQMNGGKIVYALADFPDTINLGGDVTIAKVLLSSFNKRGWATKVDLFSYRKVCANGMQIKNKAGSISLSHVSKDEIDVRLSSSLDSLHRCFHDHQESLKALTQVNMTKAEAQMQLIKHFGNVDLAIEDQPHMVNVALSLFDGKGKGSEHMSAYNTAYGLLQATTEYLNHHSRKTATHLSSVLYGGKNTSAQKMMQGLVSTYL